MIVVSRKSTPFHASIYRPEQESYQAIGTHAWRLTTRGHIWRPPTDVYELEDRIIVRVEVAGMKEADFAISLDQNLLTINGVRTDSTEKRAYYQMEIPFGEFSTQVEIIWPIELDRVEAEYQDGFLRVIMPKAQPKQIKITKDS